MGVDKAPHGRELEKVHPPRCTRGFTVFVTGLSGAGKSTIARALAAARREVRVLIEPVDGFVEVHVAIPIEICEARDSKG